LAVSGVIFIPDHEVDAQSLETPVCVRLHKLTHEIDIFKIENLQQHNGQVAGNCISPQSGLSATVLAMTPASARNAEFAYTTELASRP
jgi:hypothetical protein